MLPASEAPPDAPRGGRPRRPAPGPDRLAGPAGRPVINFPGHSVLLSDIKRPGTVIMAHPHKAPSVAGPARAKPLGRLSQWSGGVYVTFTADTEAEARVRIAL